MRSAQVSVVLLAAALCCNFPSAVLGAQPEAAASEQPSVWQHHQAMVSYFGITSLYTCDGLEDKVRALLQYLGARADLKVHATGCPGGPNRPSTTAWVNVDFYSLAPAAVDAPGALSARWTRLAVMPDRPTWMGAGECELMDQLKELILKNFSARSVDYSAHCFPHDVGLADYALRGEFLRADTAKPG